MVLQKIIDDRFVYFWNDNSQKWEGLKENASKLTFIRASTVMLQHKFKEDQAKALRISKTKTDYSIEPL